MHSLEKFLDGFRVPHSESVRLRDHDPGWSGDPELPKEERKRIAEEYLSQEVSKLAKAQDLLYASDSYSVLIILQAMDAAGKDGTIKHVMSGVNPQGCQVFSFKQPSTEELDHTFLWRHMKCLPERGRIGIFNRSYYEDVLVVKVHPNLIDGNHLPGADPTRKEFWSDRYEDINDLEKHLVRNGTLVLKFFLHLSKDEQRKRFLKRLRDPDRHWKFSASDVAERAYWDEYQQAFEDMLNATSTKHAPWYIIPADHKWVTRALVSTIICNSVNSLGLKYPEVTPDKKQQLLDAERALEAERGTVPANGQAEDDGSGDEDRQPAEESASRKKKKKSREDD